MAQKAIRFQKIASDTNLVAIAQVSLFPGVYLRGWHIIKKNDKVEVLLPHKIYLDPETGEEKTWSLLKFDNEEICQRWFFAVRFTIHLAEGEDRNIQPLRHALERARDRANVIVAVVCMPVRL